MTRLILCFVLGVGVLQQCATLPSWMFLLGGLFLILVLLFGVRHTIVRAILVYGLALLMGLTWATFRADYRLSEMLSLAWEQKPILIEGVVAELPSMLDHGVRFAFDVEQVLSNAKSERPLIPSHIVLSEYGNPKEATFPFQSRYHAGERWQLLVKLKRPHAQLNPHGFDMEAWSLERNIRAVGTVVIRTPPKLIDSKVWHPAYVVEMIREKIAHRMSIVIGHEQYYPVLLALAIGQDDAIARDDWLVFLRTGITHLISISGLHITMLSGMVSWLIYQLWKRHSRLVSICPARKIAIAAGVITALLYALIAGFSIPTQRTLFMLLMFALAFWSGHLIPMRKVLAWALFFVCLLDPWATLSPGFWLSFGAVLVMVIALSGRLARPSWWKEAIHTQWVVTIGLIPLLLILFGQFSLISPIANALAIPLISLIVTPLTLIGSMLPIDSALWLAHASMAQGMKVLVWLSAQSMAVWKQQSPLIPALMVGLVGALWLLFPTGLPFRRLATVTVLPMIMLQPKPIAAGSMQATVLDVGQGLSVSIKTRNHVLLYDTGPLYSKQADAGSRILLPYLQGEGIKSINGLIVSHDDSDHTGGLVSILEETPTDWILTSLPLEDQRLKGQHSIACRAGQYWQWDGVRFSVLYPTLNTDTTALKDNNKSCVLKVETSGGSLLIPGDIEREAERSMAESIPELLRSDIIVAPHHGSKTSSTALFLSQVQPHIVIYPVGYLNRHHHPHPKVLARYDEVVDQSYRTDRDGAVIATLNNQTFMIDTYRTLEKRYWHGR